MKSKDIFLLKVGDKINHKHYGICTVDKVILGFGISIIPDTFEMKVKLKRQANTVEMFRNTPIGTPLLEISFRLILNKIEPII